nr:ATP-binding protein [Pseudomonas sp. C9-3]
MELDEDQLQELALLRRIVSGLPYPISIRAPDTRVLFCNQAALDFLGVTAEAAIGKRLGELDEFSDPHEAELLRENMAAAIKAGEPYEADVEMRLKKGRRVVSYWGRPYLDKNGALLGAVCGSLNITDQNDLVRDLRNVNVRIEGVSQSKTEYLRGVAEEMKGPLQIINAMISLDVQKNEPDARSKPLLVARSVSNNLLAILDDVQLLCNLKVGRIMLVKEDVNLKELILGQLASFQAAAKNKKVDLVPNFDLAPRSRVWCDPLRLRQVLQNLLENALKYTEDGAVTVQLCARGVGKGMVEAVFEITDTGIGMSESDQRRIFEPFAYDLDGNRIGQGRSGLGLAISKGLVALMGGVISAESRLGVGTKVVFKVRLPDAGI